ncbi:hypothetical protein Rhe02_55450 [Rhizocola hellebori]|uniref:Uncharacterized protein n=1 Tax=Rhizocola hellebori TaxID=1392758 RepID=A0A8J3QD29_9ACTN|nr:hypothetical protein [Rhizocola hellebori]GIH07478.1 hypothetical protein Rhe02_55450 [Rhizocola hellebori]
MSIYLLCPMPECATEQQLCELDPDASLSAMLRHFIYGHPDTDSEFLMTIVEEVQR